MRAELRQLLLQRRQRPAATIEELGLAYRAFLGDGDARSKSRPELLDALYAPFRQVSLFGPQEAIPFGEFYEINTRRVSLYQAPVGVFKRVSNAAV